MARNWSHISPLQNVSIGLVGAMGFPGGAAGKESACNAGDLGSVSGLGRSLEKGTLATPVFWPGEFHGLCECSCVGNEVTQCWVCGDKPEIVHRI